MTAHQANLQLSSVFTKQLAYLAPPAAHTYWPEGKAFTPSWAPAPTVASQARIAAHLELVAALYKASKPAAGSYHAPYCPEPCPAWKVRPNPYMNRLGV